MQNDNMDADTQVKNLSVAKKQKESDLLSPKISIIIPVYNTERFLAKCLESAINQTFSDIELLCIDDGSSDGSFVLLQNFAKKDERVKVFSQKNKGVSAARNVGLDNAKGKYIMFVDSDDFIEQNACELLYERAETDNLDVLIFGANTYRDDIKVKDAYRGLETVSTKFSQRIFTLEQGKNFIFLLPRETWLKFIKKELINESKLRFREDIMICEDIVFGIQLYFSANSFGILKKNLYNYMLGSNPNSAVMTLSEEKMNRIIENFKLMEQTALNADPQMRIFSYWANREIVAMQNWLTNPLIKQNKELAKSYYLKLKELFSNLNPDIYTPTKLDTRPMSIIENIKKSTYEEFANNCQTKTYKLLGITFFKKEKTNSAKKYYLFNLPIYVASKTREKSAKRFCGIQFYKRIVRGDRIKYYIFGVQARTKRLKNLDTPIVALSNFGRLLTISNQHQKVFPQFQNKYVGRDIVILGAGPSLKFYEPIKNAIHIGVNRTFKFDKVNLDYLFLIDYPNVKSYIEEANNYNRGKCVKFYGAFFNQNFVATIPDSEVVKANALRFYDSEQMFRDMNFTKDITTMPFTTYHSVVFDAVQFAIFTNPKTIYLAGCDNNFNGYFDGGKQLVAESRFYSTYYVKNMEGWKKLKDFRNLHYPETDIISINPVGLKGMFDEDIFTNDFLEKGLG